MKNDCQNMKKGHKHTALTRKCASCPILEHMPLNFSGNIIIFLLLPIIARSPHTSVAPKLPVWYLFGFLGT